MEEIRYKILSMRNQQMTENCEGVVTLHDEWIEWIAVFDAKEPKSDDDPDDHSLGFETLHSHYHVAVLRNDIAGVELEFLHTKEKWKNVDKDKWAVRVIRYGQDIVVYYRSSSKAQEVFDKIKKWWLGDKFKADE